MKLLFCGEPYNDKKSGDGPVLYLGYFISKPPGQHDNDMAESSWHAWQTEQEKTKLVQAEQSMVTNI